MKQWKMEKKGKKRKIENEEKKAAVGVEKKEI
jgi:hypothetical protein